MRKRNLHFSDEFEAELEDLIALTGLKGTYGAIPRALAFSVSFSLEMLRITELVTPVLKADKMALLSTSITNSRERRCILAIERSLKEREAKVTPQNDDK